MQSKKLLLGLLLLVVLLPAALLLSTTVDRLLHAPMPAWVSTKEARRSVQTYQIPDVVLVDHDGKKVSFRSYLESGKPVLLDFIYGTCATVGPTQSASFVSLQQKLGAHPEQLQLLSISTDPESDTPQTMRGYLKKFHRKPGWDFLTGSRSDIEGLLRAFDAYRPVMIYHDPLMLMLKPSDGKWLRLNGAMSASELMQEYENMVRR